MTIHGVHHSTGSTFGGLTGRSMSRSRVGRLRRGVRGDASGCVGRISTTISTGDGRVVAMWKGQGKRLRRYKLSFCLGRVVSQGL